MGGNAIKADRRIAQLEAQVEHCEGHAAELEAEVMAWRERLGLAVAENARLKAALDRYSEDEMLLRLRDSGGGAPETDAIKVDTGLPQLEYYVALAGQYETLARSLEKKLGLAVAALESVAVDSQERFIRGVARAALAQIESK
jgi:hypothetical protein